MLYTFVCNKSYIQNAKESERQIMEGLSCLPVDQVRKKMEI